MSIPSPPNASTNSRLKPVLKTMKYYAKIPLHRYRSLNIYGKIFVWALILFYISLGAFVIIVTPARIFQFLYDRARWLAEARFGYLILSVVIVLACFPPLIGYTTLITLCGFAYGMKGFWLAAPASIVGSALVFILLRYFFSDKLRAWSTSNAKWAALEAVVRAKGLPLIILIRISPFPPWIYSNVLFASIQPVFLWQFIIATIFVFPKLLLQIFIGSKIAAFADGDQRSHMDTQTKVVNGILIGGGILIAIVTSVVVYRLVQGHIRHMEGIDPEVDELAAEAIEGFNEDAPLLRSFSNTSS